MSYRDAVEFLLSLQLFGAKPGLERALRLAELAGHPENRLRFIHVAGTNGKGSVCAMLESIYRASGLRVGLYTSPHLVSFRERMQVNRALITEADVVRFVVEARQWLRAFSDEDHATFFEVVTVMALRFFAEQRCDLVIWETGLGGRLDATNIVTPLASVITNVQFDHEKWLGSALEEIAREKAGIIKPRVPVITAAQEPALGVIRRRAGELLAPLHEARAVGLPERIGLRGAHQRENAAVAIKTVEVLAHALPVNPSALREGLAAVSWPGRFQMLQRGAQVVVLDGAHNPAGARALVDSLRAEFPGAKPVFIVGVLDDKDWRAVINTFAEVAAELIFVPVASKRTAQPETLANDAPSGARTASGLREALELATTASHLVITGSLYLIGEALEVLGVSPAADERALNEWSAASAAPGSR